MPLGNLKTLLEHLQPIMGEATVSSDKARILFYSVYLNEKTHFDVLREIPPKVVSIGTALSPYLVKKTPSSLRFFKAMRTELINQPKSIFSGIFVSVPKTESIQEKTSLQSELTFH